MMAASYPRHDMEFTHLDIYGTFIDTPASGELRIREDTWVRVDIASGTIVSISTEMPSEPPGRARKKVVRMPPEAIVVPGFVDCHVHAPQYKQLGTKTDVPLMEWLEKYTFPAEAAFSSTEHAEKVYTQLIRRLLRNGTTTACYFGSNHLAASLVLADVCGKFGQRALVGKNCSDQLVPDFYVETTEGSLKDTESFIIEVRKKFGATEDSLVMPVVTPRFVPTCSVGLLKGLGELAHKYGVHVQTHAAESVDQVALVRSQFPVLRRDVTILSTVGLLTPKTVLAHCTHLYDAEASALSAIGASIASCPYSNMLFARAVLPVNRFSKLGVKIGLGTDIAGGHSANMLSAVRLAALVSRIEGFRPPKERAGDPFADEEEEERKREDEPVEWKQSFYLGTRGGALALGLDRVGAFDVGMKWDAVEVDLSWEEEEEEQEGSESTQEDFERWVCGHGGEASVRKVWVDGKEVFAIG